MKKILLFISPFLLISCSEKNKNTATEYTADFITENLKFNEGTLVYQNELLVSNFGGTELNPLNVDGKGYIVKINEQKSEVFIPTDGYLSAPKGMAISDNHIYIADVSKVVIYNLNDLKQIPRVIKFPEGDLFVNDIAIIGTKAYVSVTNSGKIYVLDISDSSNIDETKLSLYMDLAGANGLLIDGNSMYVASYSPDGTAKDENVIYKIENLSSPVATKLIERKGQYDGLALKEGKLYFSNWNNSEIGYVNLSDGKIEILNIKDSNLNGPADISIMGDKLYIPDLPSSKLVVIKL